MSGTGKTQKTRPAQISQKAKRLNKRMSSFYKVGG
nr:MAG TPA: hypothetical protein [Caudoviricetes sp.]DAN83475.1 MAG TPA: hypothetical protein [Caudoviricetes sp.]